MKLAATRPQRIKQHVTQVLDQICTYIDSATLIKGKQEEGDKQQLQLHQNANWYRGPAATESKPTFQFDRAFSLGTSASISSTSASTVGSSSSLPSSSTSSSMTNPSSSFPIASSASGATPVVPLGISRMPSSGPIDEELQSAFEAFAASFQAPH